MVPSVVSFDRSVLMLLIFFSTLDKSVFSALLSKAEFSKRNQEFLPNTPFRVCCDEDFSMKAGDFIWKSEPDRDKRSILMQKIRKG